MLVSKYQCLFKNCWDCMDIEKYNRVFLQSWCEQITVHKGSFMSSDWSSLDPIDNQMSMFVCQFMWHLSD